MRWARSILILGTAVVLLVGCGTGGEGGTTEKKGERPQKPQSFDVTLDGYPSLETAGILMARKRGYFDEVGLTVNITSPVTPLNVTGYVDERVIDLGVSHQPQVVTARAKGASILAVGSLVRQPTMAMIWLKKSGIDKIADLKGKTIAVVDFPFEVGFLESFLKRAGLTLDDVKVQRVSYRLTADLASGRADAILGGSGNVEGAELEARGLEPVITPVQRLGIPAYEELVLVARPDRLSRDPDSIRDFMAAVARGTAAAVEDPGAAAAAVATARAELEPVGPRKPKPTKAQVEAVLPLLSRTGRMNPEQVARLVDWMHREGLVQQAPPISDLLTDDYLEPAP